jgi:hypothetical protein
MSLGRRTVKNKIQKLLGSLALSCLVACSQAGIVARMAAARGDHVVRYLSEFSAIQGWIRQDQVRKARVAD